MKEQPLNNEMFLWQTPIGEKKISDEILIV